MVACIADFGFTGGYFTLSVIPAAQTLTTDVDCDKLRVSKVLV